MHVRWERRRWSGQEGAGYSLVARLVEPRWVDGRVRDRYLGHLGAMMERSLAYPPAREVFRARIAARLVGLVGDADTRRRLMQSVDRRVPEPTEQERADARVVFPRRLDDVPIRMPRL